MNTDLPFCPCCGHNLAAEQPMAVGSLAVDPRGDASWEGRAIHFTPGERIVLDSIVQARGRLVPAPALRERIGYEGLGNVLDVFLVRIRRKLRQAGAPATLIETAIGRGYRLNLEAL